MFIIFHYFFEEARVTRDVRAVTLCCVLVVCCLFCFILCLVSVLVCCLLFVVCLVLNSFRMFLDLYYFVFSFDDSFFFVLRFVCVVVLCVFVCWFDLCFVLIRMYRFVYCSVYVLLAFVLFAYALVFC